MHCEVAIKKYYTVLFFIQSATIWHLDNATIIMFTTFV